MAMTVQQIHPVAHLPLVLGVLRRLAVATVGNGLMPPHPAHVLSCGRGVEALVLAILVGDHALYKPMVLVSDKPSNGIGFLLTKLCHREGYEARGVGLEAMPLDQQIECGHGECEPGMDIRPGPAHDLFEVADQRQHREHRLHQHAVLPLAALTPCEVGRIAFRSMKGGVAQDNHALFNLANEPLQGVIRDIGGGTRPPYNQPPLVQHQPQFAPDNPAVVREACTANLLRTAAFAHGVDQLDPIRVEDAEHRRGGQEDLRPVLMGRQEAKEPCPLGYVGEQGPIVTCQPPRERPVPHAFEGMEQSQGDHLTGPEVCLKVCGDEAHLLIDLVE